MIRPHNIRLGRAICGVPGSGETPEYNSVDAALWYIEAWRAYIEATDDWASLRVIFPVLEA